MKLGVLASHPIQYYAPLFRELAKRCDLTVYFAHRQTPEGQAAAGFGVSFQWDVDLFSGYRSIFLQNVSDRPGTDSFAGCDTPGIGDEIAANRFDAFLVTGWNLKSYWQAIRACRRWRTPVMARGDSQLATPRSWPKRIIKSSVYPYILGRFDAMLYVGEKSRDYLTYYKVASDKQFFSPHCVDNAWFAAESAKVDLVAAREQLGILTDESVFVFVGKLIGIKRPCDLINAAAVTQSAGLRCRVMIVGDGPLRDAVKEAVFSAGVSATMLGFKNQTEMPALYSVGDALVLPSAQETWGLVVNEGMATGLPAIVSDAVGCAPDLIEQGKTGWTYPAGRIDLLATAMQRSIGMRGRPETQRALGKKMVEYSVDSAAAGVMRASVALSLGRGIRADPNL